MTSLSSRIAFGCRSEAGMQTCGKFQGHEASDSACTQSSWVEGGQILARARLAIIRHARHFIKSLVRVWTRSPLL